MAEAYGLLLDNLLSPLVIAFIIGMAATLLRSELEFPQPVLNAISIYLVFSIALQGGAELSEESLASIWRPALAAVFVAIALPIWGFIAARRFLRLEIPNAAGIAALYGSVSSVTFLAALNFASKLGTPAEPFLPALVSVMEWGILSALCCARVAMTRSRKGKVSLGEIVVDTLRGRSVILMLGGLAMGWTIGKDGYEPIEPLFGDVFKGVLVLFLLEMGMVAARQLRAFAAVGPRLIVWALAAPILHGLVGVMIGKAAGLSLGGSFVFGCLTASASYIDAPAAVRAAMPEANPSIYLTSSLGITFPFNLLVGLPIYYAFAHWLHGTF